MCIRKDVWQQALSVYANLEQQAHENKFHTSVDSALLAHINEIKTAPEHSALWNTIQGTEILLTRLFLDNISRKSFLETVVRRRSKIIQ
jgi:hypothetical protein